MATVKKEIVTKATAEQVWAAIRDIGALHTRLVPGFVTNTKVEGSVRIVTFGNGRVVREPIVTIDDDIRRLVWSAESDWINHYNGAVQVRTNYDGTSTVEWTADFLPNQISPTINDAIEAGMAVMKQTLDALA